MGKKRTTAAATEHDVGDETPIGFDSLSEMLRAVKLKPGNRVYRVVWPDGKGAGRKKFVITNSPGRAASACCHVDRVEPAEIIRAYSDIVVQPPPETEKALPGQIPLPIGDSADVGD